MNPAQPRFRQKHAASVRLVSQNRRAAQHQRAAHGLNSLKFRMLIPLLLLEPRKIIGVQLESSSHGNRQYTGGNPIVR